MGDPGMCAVGIPDWFEGSLGWISGKEMILGGYAVVELEHSVELKGFRGGPDLLKVCVSQ
jgi:hypothetical protein